MTSVVPCNQPGWAGDTDVPGQQEFHAQLGTRRLLHERS